MKNIICILLALVISNSAFAGDAATYHQLGFSKDGNYFAFAQYGVQDGSGFPYAEVGIVDVAKNRYVSLVKHIVKDEEAGSTETLALARALKKSPLKNYGILPGKNLGEDLIVRSPNDQSDYTSVIFTTYRNAEGGAVPEAPRYRLNVLQKDAGPNEFCNDENKMVRLTLDSELDDGNPLHLVLQDDQTQPLVRECSFGYSVTHVTLRGSSFVVVLEYARDGFEGPDYRSMVVTKKVVFP